MIGDFLLPLLVEAGHDVVATSRHAHAPQQGVHWLVAQIEESDWLEHVGQVDAWVNFTSLTLLGKVLEQSFLTLKPGRIIAFSSTSRFTKKYARGEKDRSLAEMLEAGEEELIRICEAHGLSWNILRPTLIYSLGRDKNLTQISRFIQCFHFFPLVGSGQALRQPVHAEDLAVACLQLLDADSADSRAYNLSGSEILSYRSMVERLFEKCGVKPRVVHAPLSMLQLMLNGLRLLPRYRYLTPDMANRMEMDMTFSHDEATRDFGYAPRSFLP